MADNPVAWLRGTGRTDWLFDGHKPPSEDVWQRLVWEQAYVDMGPSLMGNPGPYWHVPLRDEDGEIDTVHRLYPRLLLTKWLLIVRRACEEVAAKPPGRTEAILTEAARAVLAAWDAQDIDAYEICGQGDMQQLFGALRAALAEEERAAAAPGKSAEERARPAVDWAMRQAELVGIPHRMAAMPESVPAIDISTGNLRALLQTIDRAGYERGCRETCAAGMRALTETTR